MAAMGNSSFTLLVIVSSIALAILAVYVWYRFYRQPRDLNAPHRLGQEMGLQQLNEGSRKDPVWYGGRHGDREFATTYANLRYGSYGPKHARTVEDVVLSLRLAVPLKISEPQDIIAYFHHGRPFKAGEEPEDFEEAFDRRNTKRLSEESRDALLHFTQTYGGLRLRDRATAPEALFVDEVLTDTPVVLVHDRPGYKQTPEEVTLLLDALLEVARQVESDPAFVDGEIGAYSD